jgi:manganese efflux pump family protein
VVLRIVAFVAPLTFDTFAIAIALGLRGVNPWRPAVVFAIFEAVMPIFGIVIGRTVGERFAQPSEIAGGIVLIAIGVHAFREAIRGNGEFARVSFNSARTAAIAGLGVSMDEIAAGFPMGVAHLPIAGVLITLGVQAFLMALAGISIGARVGAIAGRLAERYAHVIAGVAFGAVGIWLVAQAFA